MKRNIRKWRKSITVVGAIMILVMAIIIPIAINRINIQLGMETDLWAHFYLGNTPTPLTLEIDWEDGHPIREDMIRNVISTLREVCDRPVVYNPVFTDQVNIPSSVYDTYSGEIDKNILHAGRDTLETWDTIYIVLVNDDYSHDVEYSIAGMFIAPGSILISQIVYDQNLEYYTLVHECGHAFGLGHYEEDCFMNAVLNPGNLPIDFCDAALADMDLIRGYYYRGGEGLVVIIWVIARQEYGLSLLS